MLCRIPMTMFAPMDSLSAWEKLLNRVIRNSLDSVRVLIFSFSKITAMPLAFRVRITLRQSTVFRANLDADLVRIMSMRPRLQAAIMRLNSARFFMLVPLRPSSANVKHGTKEKCK